MAVVLVAPLAAQAQQAPHARVSSVVGAAAPMPAMVWVTMVPKRERVRVELGVGGGLEGWAHGAMAQVPVLPDARIAGGTADVVFSYRRMLDDDADRWLVLRADLGVRVGSEQPLERGHDVLVAYARVVPTVGVETKHARFAAGLYLGNGGDARTDAVAWPALSAGVGDRDVFMLHVDLLSQPGCFAGQCLVGASFTTPLAWGELHAGFSVASDKAWRAFVRVPLSLGSFRAYVLADAGAVREQPTFGLSIGAALGD